MNREQRRENQFKIEKYIKGSNAIEGIFDPAEIEQSLVAWDYLQSLNGILSHADIMHVQKIITINQEELKPNQRGYYRGIGGNNINVKVGGRTAPHYSKVEELMKAWLEDMPKMTPLLGHIRFESIHPFVDGNGRTGRMIYWYICQNNGKKPIYYGVDTYPERTPKENREHYYRLFDKKRIEYLQKNNWGIDFDGTDQEGKKQ